MVERSPNAYPSADFTDWDVRVYALLDGGGVSAGEVAD